MSSQSSNLPPNSLKTIHLEDKYLQEEGQIFLTGIQALVRLPLMQKRLDLSNGLNTAGYISGYRGSPLGGYDMALWKAQKHLTDHHIHFRPGINEELGATSVWGSQQLQLSPGARYQGVFAIWYGKGPGVDRSGDALKHGNFAGSSTYGGVLALCGDDHACKSSTLPHQSEYALMDAFIPILHPATVQDVLDLGLYGWALSRYSGLWVGFKMLSDTADTAASVLVDPHRFSLSLPQDFSMPEGGLNFRWPDPPLDQEQRMHLYKLNAAKAFIRSNTLNQVVRRSPKPRIGLIAVGKGYLDLCQALEGLGLSAHLEELGISIFKIVVSWPLEPQGILAFCRGLDEVIVVEEKRPLIEGQVKDILYHLPADQRPRVVGKKTEKGRTLLPSTYELTAQEIAVALAKRLVHLSGFEPFKPTFDHFLTPKDGLPTLKDSLTRLPFYCSGCPHNISTTQVPEGSRALAGIGCHYMATWIDTRTETFTQMGGEGVPWIGIAPFTDEPHIFANLGDGTYYHSGLLAIRASVAANVNITYKILYNDAVAMTGGQPVDGPLTVPDITHQLYAERIRHIAVVTDDPEKYPSDVSFAPGVTVHHRDQLPLVQEAMKKTKGTTAIVYDQACAAEKRRKRKRGLLEDPKKRIFINEAVCEGCGDCSVKSNCLSVVPLETEWGRKRAIDQSSCNKDYSCVQGFCPSFVTVIGGELRKPQASHPPEDLFDQLPDPVLPDIGQDPYDIFITGIGGTGVITVGTLIGMAAHLEGKGCSVVDMAGLAQKGGAVVSHVRLAQNPEDIHATRVHAEGARLILGFDMVVTSGKEALSKIKQGITQVVLNSHQTVTGHFTKNPNYHFPSEEMTNIILTVAGQENVHCLEAQKIATNLLGDSLMTNIFMVGYALQKGYVPVSVASFQEAIRLNGVSVSENLLALQWGRLAAVDKETVHSYAHRGHHSDPDHVFSKTVDEMIDRRVVFLQKYQSKRYGKRYRRILEKVRKSEASLGSDRLTWEIAQSLYRLMAYKDEYEVARLYTDGEFKRRLQEQFEGNYQLQFHLAPPLLAKRNEKGELQKKVYGPSMMVLFKLLAKFKFLRGTPFDPFGYAAERQRERKLIRTYHKMIDKLLKVAKPDNLENVCEVAKLPQRIRGFGHVKEQNYQKIEQLIRIFMEG